MIIKRTDKYLEFSFERKDWQIRKGDLCRGFIAELKEQIPDGWRDYNSERETWTLLRHLVNSINGLTVDQMFDALKEKYFVDPKQSRLF